MMLQNNQDMGPVYPRYALLGAFWSIGTVIILIVIKAYAHHVSNSTAILGSLTDTIVDTGISVIMLFAIAMSLKPADANHRYGHGKVEGLAGIFQAGLMIGAASFIGFYSVMRFNEPKALEDHGIAITVSLISIVLTLILLAVQSYAQKKSGSLALEAEKSHYKADTLLNLGVVLAVSADLYGAPGWVDPAAGLVIALYFAISARHIGLKSADMLMDTELPDAVRNRIEKTVMAYDDVWGMHDLRTRRSGMTIHISFDMEIDPEMSVRDAHEIVRQVEHSLLADFPHAEILIHVDPYGDIHDSRHKVPEVHH